MHRDSPARRQETENGITGNRATAFRVVDHRALRSADGERALWARRARGRRALGRQLACHHGCHPRAQTDICEEIIPRFQAQHLHQAIALRLAHRAIDTV